jgi:hypothetical protein
MSATGTTRVGMIVARKLCRNTSITMNTSTIAITSVMITSSIAVMMNFVESNGTNHSTPAGRLGASSSMRVFTASATSSAFAPGCSNTPKPATGCPLKRASEA